MKGTVTSVHHEIPYCFERFDILPNDTIVTIPSNFANETLGSLYIVYKVQEMPIVGETVLVKRYKSFWEARIVSNAGKVRWLGKYKGVRSKYMAPIGKIYRKIKVYN